MPDNKDMDIFSVFSKANELYRLIAQDDPSVDVTLPVFSSEAEKHTMNVVFTPRPTSGKAVTELPVQVYEDLPKIITGDLEYVRTKLGGVIEALRSPDVSLYRQFAELLSQFFHTGPQDLLGLFAGYFQMVMSGVPVEGLQITVKWDYPAQITVLFPPKSASIRYDFSRRTLFFLGVPVPENVDQLALSQQLAVPVLHVSSEEYGVVEAWIRLPSYGTRKVSLLEWERPMETADEILDFIIQKLIMADLLDGLQDVIFDDEQSSLYLCFDPVLDKDEVEFILSLVKPSYPQAMIADTPGEDGSAWWVISVGDVPEAAAQTELAGSEGAPDGTGVIAKEENSTMTQIAKEVDTDAALAAISKE